jgi:hypothetical protein
MFAYLLFAYIVRQVSDPKMASLPNHYVANSSSFGNTPKHTGRAQRVHRGSTDSISVGARTHNHSQSHTHTHLDRWRRRRKRRKPSSLREHYGRNTSTDEGKTIDARRQRWRVYGFRTPHIRYTRENENDGWTEKKKTANQTKQNFTKIYLT